MSKSLLHDWESSIEKNKNNTEELLKIAEDIYNTAYARGQASTERPQGEWIEESKIFDGVGDSVLVITCSICKTSFVYRGATHNYCSNCGADMRGEEE